MAKIGRPKETKRGESPHPGVKIVPKQRPGGIVYFARWADPDKSRAEPIIGPDGQPIRHPNGRLRTKMRYVWVEKSLDAMGKKTVKARELWCKAKSKDLLAPFSAPDYREAAALLEDAGWPDREAD